ncbi:transposase [Acetobacter orleanensis NRIC 0473]|uniref:Transposase InsH N-terminal domain-containing protein n=1 Tax=Acetobacter orleanensis TaxID=104099 RepID=A0A4Y3TTS3_9PROT|nr:transposase [Acetobacter orleanensis JCM 7639]GBR24994.1 transposase [Acetobacter orleanensis NRIC 0473]GEB84175.1 hypothetical protein AOR01nite_26520 [Acetobacter orleanensis]
MKQGGFFDVEERLARLSGLGDQLEAFSRTVDFEVFRPDLEKALAYSDGSKGGRPPFDAVLMIQTLNNLSDERTEYLINDRLSFIRFLGLELSDRVPDAKTVWLFRERLTQAGAIDGLFNCFDAILRNAGYLPMSGQVLDATLVAASNQRNTNAEKADLRAGQARKAVAQRSSCTLDAEVHESEAAGRWNHAIQRSRHPVLWLQIPPLHRPEVPVHPEMEDDGCRRQ